VVRSATASRTGVAKPAIEWLENPAACRASYRWNSARVGWLLEIEFRQPGAVRAMNVKWP
jgi:hypothetical protein